MPKRRTTRRRQKGGFLKLLTATKRYNKKPTPAFWAGIGRRLTRQRGRGLGALAVGIGAAAARRRLKRRLRR